jgi:hypothetical protein
MAFCISSFVCSEAVGQFLVFRTVEDFINETPEVYEGYEFFSQKGKWSDIVITIINESTKHQLSLDCSSMWGFIYKENLFRIVRNEPYRVGAKDDNFYVLHKKGKAPCTWIRGERILEDLKKGLTNTFSDAAIPYYISATLTGGILSLPQTNFGGKTGKDFRSNGAKFFSDNPQLAWLDECARKHRWFKNGLYTDWAIFDCLRDNEEKSE